MTIERDNPNVIAPPPLIFLGGLLAGAFLSWFFPVEFLPKTLARAAGVVLMIVGSAIIVAAIGQMRRAATNVEPWKPTTKILDTGLYAVSRNPIYVAMCLIYLGVGCLFNSLWSLLILPLVFAVVHYGVVRREEAYLARKFGDEYENYKNRVRRWI